jgi:hypothetical protein
MSPAAGIESLSRHLIELVEDPVAFSAAYGEYLGSLLSEPLWSPAFPGRSRLPWRLAAEAKKADPAWAAAFGKPGVYLFGSATFVPLYWGMTEKGTLWTRLNGRYVGIKKDGSQKSQCQLAADYENELVANGLDGFPVEVVALYRKNYPSGPRLRHAVAFAQNGIKGIWITVIPASTPAIVNALEKTLIAVGGAWNLSNGLPPLLNTL